VAQKSDNRSQSAQGQVPTQPGRHDEIGASPFLGIRHLLFQNGSQANRCHAGAPQHPLALHQGRCRHHEDIITPAIAAGFKQQRNIQHGKRLAPGAGVIEKPLLSGGDHRMKDLLQPLERSQIPDPAEAKMGAENDARLRAALPAAELERLRQAGAAMSSAELFALALRRGGP